MGIPDYAAGQADEGCYDPRVLSKTRLADPKPQAEIPACLDQLEKEIALLAQACGTLEARISPVCAPTSCDAKPHASPEQVSMTELGGKLRSLAGNVRSLRNRVDLLSDSVRL